MYVKRMLTMAFAIALVACVVPGMASASTLTASVDPSVSGTSSAPAPANVKVSAVLDGGGFLGISSYSTLLPAEMTPTLSKFGTCPTTFYDEVGESPSVNCPDKSAIVGSAELAIFAFGSMSGGKASIVKVDETHLVIWYAIPPPAPAGTELFPGVISIENGAPLITWNVSSIQAVELVGLTTTFERNPTGTASPFSTSGCAKSSWAFEARIDYVTLPDQTATTTVPCTQGVAFVPPVVVKPAVTLKAPKSIGLSKLVKERKLQPHCKVTQPSTCSIDATIAASLAKKLGFNVKAKAKTVVVGKGSVTATKAGNFKVIVKLKKSATTKFKKAGDQNIKQMKLKLKATGSNEGGKSTKTTTVTVKVN